MTIFPKDKEKRVQFIFVIFCTVIALGLIIFLLIQPQYDALRRLAKGKVDAQAQLAKIKGTIKSAGDTSAQLSGSAESLGHAEADVASGDVYAWVYDTIRRFKANYHVDIPTLSQPSITDVDVIANFPYKQVRVNVSGTAYYHDLGKFIADFENAFPHIRVVDLTIEPANTGRGSDSEKLSFRMDIVALVKTTT